MNPPESVNAEQGISEERRRLDERRRTAAWEAGFLDRSFWMSVAVSVFVACFLLALGRSRETASYALGAAVSIALLWSTRYSVVNVLTRQDLGKRKKWIAFGLTVSKYGLAAMLIWWFTRWPHAHLLAFVGGVGTTQAVLFLKALGRVLSGEKPPAGWRERTPKTR